MAKKQKPALVISEALTHNNVIAHIFNGLSNT